MPLGLERMLTDEIVEKYLKAGKIASKVRKYALKIVKPGIRIYDLCESIERKIVEEGGLPAFPCNVSINEIAAHYTAFLGDTSTIPDRSLVKVDIGVHVDGYIADTAVTISFNPKFEDLNIAVETALERALEFIRPGVKVSKIGEIIENTIKAYGYKPIRNLSGHSIERYNLHSGTSIPNVKDFFSVDRVKVNHVYAIEPFGTSGIGYVVEGRETYIYSFKKEGKVRDEESRRIIGEIKKKYNGLPFAERWLKNTISDRTRLIRVLKNLVKNKVLNCYPVLVEASTNPVAQFEHTVLVLGKEVIVTTL